MAIPYQCDECKEKWDLDKVEISMNQHVRCPGCGSLFVKCLKPARLAYLKNTRRNAQKPSNRRRR